MVASCSSMIGLINLEVKCAGARSAGNPHAACDVEGAGNVVTERPIRARRGKPRIQTRSLLVSYRASSRPYQAIARIIKYGGDTPEIAFNYRSDYNGLWDNAAWMDDYGYSVRYGNEGSITVKL